jgi:hypothetical protein
VLDAATACAHEQQQPQPSAKKSKTDFYGTLKPEQQKGLY